MKKNVKFGIIILILVMIIIFTLYFLYKDQKIAVLGYHNVYKDESEVVNKDQFTMHIDKFEKQMKFLKKHNYKTLSLEEFRCWKKKECKQPRKSVLITFDDGYYFNYKYAMPILKKLNMKATVFIVGKYIGPIYENSATTVTYFSKDILTKIKDNYPNIEIQSHSFDMHGSKNVANMSAEELKQDISKINEIISTEYWAYPGGRYTKEMIKILKEEKYKMAFGFGKDTKKQPHRKAKQSDNDFLIPRLNIDANMSYLKFKMIISFPVF